MRVKLTALVGGLVSAVAILLSAAVTTPAAQAATLSHASSASPHAFQRPAYTAKVTVTVRCGKFAGEINHGGTGGILNRAYLQVEGKLSSSCNSTTYLQVRYDIGPETFPGTIIKTVGSRRTADVDWEIRSIAGTYGNIGIRVGTNDGMREGEILWGPWRDV
jgi:hypothetical protein